MASCSTSVERGWKTTSKRLEISDCICPICLYIFIEPVTMPCGHELCMYCFKKNVQEASLSCPMCRLRISTWTRRAVRHNKLINEQRWADIQRQFPDKVQKRLLGIDDEEIDERGYIPLQPIAQPGEIHKEYEDQLHKLRAESDQKRMDEEEASMKLIEQLKEQEEQEKKERERLTLSDEAIAKELAEKIREEQGLTPIGAKKGERRARAGANTPTFMDKFLSKSKDSCEKEIYPFNVLNSVGDEKKTTLNSIHPNLSTCSMNEVFKDLKNSGTNFSDSPSTSFLSPTSSFVNQGQALDDPPLPQIKPDEPGDGVSFMIDPDEDSLGFSSVQIKQALEESKRESAFNSVCKDKSATYSTTKEQPSTSTKDPTTKPAARSSSVVSEDSMSTEMAHFKPIDRSPRTPPRRLPGGQVYEAPVVRSTPRNISDFIRKPMRIGLEEEVLGHSPIMKKKITQLAAERKQQVVVMSKSTFTAVQRGDKNERTLSPSITFLGEERPSPAQSFKETQSVAASPPVIDLCDTPTPEPAQIHVISDNSPASATSSYFEPSDNETSPIAPNQEHRLSTASSSSKEDTKGETSTCSSTYEQNQDDENAHTISNRVTFKTESNSAEGSREHAACGDESLSYNRSTGRTHVKRLHGRLKSSESASQTKQELKKGAANRGVDDTMCQVFPSTSKCNANREDDVEENFEFSLSPKLEITNNLTNGVIASGDGSTSSSEKSTASYCSPGDNSCTIYGGNTKKKSSIQSKINFKPSISPKHKDIIQDSKPERKKQSSSPGRSVVKGKKRKRNISAKASETKQNVIAGYLQVTDSSNSGGEKRKRKLTTRSSCNSSNVTDEVDEIRLERSDFATLAEYQKYVEEQDGLLALKLQADFDREMKYRLNSVRRKGSDGEYELRKRACRSAVC